MKKLLCLTLILPLSGQSAINQSTESAMNSLNEAVASLEADGINPRLPANKIGSGGGEGARGRNLSSGSRSQSVNRGGSNSQLPDVRGDANANSLNSNASASPQNSRFAGTRSIGNSIAPDLSPPKPKTNAFPQQLLNQTFSDQLPPPPAPSSSITNQGYIPPQIGNFQTAQGLGSKNNDYLSEFSQQAPLPTNSGNSFPNLWSGGGSSIGIPSITPATLANTQPGNQCPRETHFQNEFGKCERFLTTANVAQLTPNAFDGFLNEPGPTQAITPNGINGSDNEKHAIAALGRNPTPVQTAALSSQVDPSGSELLEGINADNNQSDRSNKEKPSSTQTAALVPDDESVNREDTTASDNVSSLTSGRVAINNGNSANSIGDNCTNICCQKLQQTQRSFSLLVKEYLRILSEIVSLADPKTDRASLETEEVFSEEFSHFSYFSNENENDSVKAIPGLIKVEKLDETVSACFQPQGEGENKKILAKELLDSCRIPGSSTLGSVNRISDIFTKATALQDSFNVFERQREWEEFQRQNINLNRSAQINECSHLEALLTLSLVNTEQHEADTILKEINKPSVH